MPYEKFIIVGMSGGVDSSVSAFLLQKQGFNVQGLFMKNWEEDDTSDYCNAAQDLKDAQAVCDSLNIPLHTVNFASEYWDNVFQHFLNEYQAGRTPNPDVLCNREIKFKAFLDYALKLGASAIATGHYVGLIKNNQQFQLIKGLDSNKDQSYFLYTLGQAQLKYCQFPLGNLTKATVRKIAMNQGLATRLKKDSTGICFIGERRFKTFLSRFLPPKLGRIETPEGDYLGKHDGLMYYTVGQRQGLGIGGQKGSSGEAWYVVAKDVPNNRLIVAQGHNHPLLFSQQLTACQLHWVSGNVPTLPFHCQAKIRYRQPDQACEIQSFDKDSCQVRFQHAQRAVALGQSIVFYENNCCLGGGIITEVA